MTLTRLGISNIRNIRSANIELTSGINLFIGANGSGKTSLLESVYFLGSGRSFRNNSVDPLISRGEKESVVFGAISVEGGQHLTLGVRRDRDGGREIKLNGERVQQASMLARCVPSLALGPNTVDLVIGPPANRRQFMNWGVFHVEPSFAALWEQLNRCLRQRNELLRKTGLKPGELTGWNEQLVRLSEQIDQQRENYFGSLHRSFIAIVEELAGIPGVSLSYFRGWDKDQKLDDLLSRQLPTDLQRGFTQSGPHRAEIRIRIGKQPVAITCSRGELKVLAWALLLAQGRVFAQETGGSLIYLVDDLSAELDSEHRHKVCRLLSETGAQILVTGIERMQFVDNWSNAEVQVFHVEHGDFSLEEKQDERR